MSKHRDPSPYDEPRYIGPTDYGVDRFDLPGGPVYVSRADLLHAGWNGATHVVKRNYRGEIILDRNNGTNASSIAISELRKARPPEPT